MIVPEDVERVVEPAADNNLCSRWGQRIIGPQELDEGVVEGDRGVVMDLAYCFKAEDVLEIEANSRTVNVIKALRSGKALIMVVDIGFFEISVSIVD